MKHQYKEALAGIDTKDFAVGNDTVFLPDFNASFNTLFQNKVYTPDEVGYCELFSQPLLRFASTWAAKEAVYKAVKQLFKKRLAFKNIQISRSKIGGIPTVSLPAEFTNIDISLSITHDGEYVWAIALAKRNYD